MMGADSGGSVSHWIEGVKNGDSLAAQELWDRYFAKLVRMALARLRGVARTESAEDVALSALKSAMIGIRDGRFPALADREGLWPLLVTITARKSITELRRELAGKRTIRSNVRFSDVEKYIGSEPTPEFAVEVVEELANLVTKFDDPALRLIVERKLDGCSHDEVANELGCSRRTVIRKLKLIRQEWEEG